MPLWHAATPSFFVETACCGYVNGKRNSHYLFIGI